MTLTIGRVDLSASTGLYDIEWIGDALSFSVDIEAVTVDRSLVLREQLRGYRVGDLVPFVWDDDPALSGFYTFAAEVATQPSVVYLSQGFIRCQVSLRRVAGGFSKPLSESVVRSQLRPNNRGYVLADAVPLRTSSTLGADLNSLVTQTGEIGERSNFSVGADGEWVYPIDVDSYYNGACRVMYLRSGGDEMTEADWFVVVGLQTPSDCDGFRIDNGLIRVDFIGRNAKMRRWLGTQWSNPRFVEFNGDGPAGDYETLRVLQSSNGDVAVTTTLGVDLDREFYDAVWSIRRGDFGVWVNLSPRTSRDEFFPITQTFGAFNVAGDPVAGQIKADRAVDVTDPDGLRRANLLADSASVVYDVGMTLAVTDAEIIDTMMTFLGSTSIYERIVR